MEKETLPRVAFHTNDPREPGVSYDLDLLENSRADLARLGDRLREGLRVVLYETGELEVEAVLHFEPDAKIWIGMADWSTIKHYY